MMMHDVFKLLYNLNYQCVFAKFLLDSITSNICFQFTGGIMANILFFMQKKSDHVHVHDSYPVILVMRKIW